MWKLLPVLFGAASLFAQARPGLFFREDWKEIPAATPVTQEHVVSPDLILSLYGPARASIKKSHHDTPADDPYYIWSGECQANWAVTWGFKSNHSGGANFAFVDGSVHFIRESIDMRTYQYLGHRFDGQATSLP